MAGSLGYIVTMSYGKRDQQTVAACSVFTQMCWLKSFGLNSKMVLVEPFTNRSHLVSNPDVWTAVEHNDKHREVMRFSDYFDLQYLQAHESTKMVSWDQFIKNAPRNVVAVTIQDLNGQNAKCFGKIGSPKLACKSGPRNQAQIDHFTSGCDTTEVDNAARYLKKFGFTVIKNVCLNCGHGLPSTGYSPNDITALIVDGIDIHNTTVIITEWTYATNLVKNCEISKYCSAFNCVKFNNNQYSKLMPSARLKEDANLYLKEVLNATSISVAIMIRTERLFRKLKSAARVIQCLTSLLDLYTDIITKKRGILLPGAKPLITIDIGTFGSTSYGPEYTNYTEIVSTFEYLLSNVYAREWSLELYEKGLMMATGGVKESGYIAGLQRVLASQARCLVLCGAGHYQGLAEHYYRLEHPKSVNQCIYHN